MLFFFKNYYLDSYKINILSYVLNFRLFNFTAYLSTKVSSQMSIFFFQISSLISKNIIIFDRMFFIELIFKRWIALSFFIFILLLFFI